MRALGLCLCAFFLVACREGAGPVMWRAPLLGAPQGDETPVFDTPLVHLRAGHQNLPALASNGAGFLLSWNDEDERSTPIVVAAHFSSIGERQEEAFVVAEKAKNPAVASNGADYFVVWEDVSQVNEAVYGRVLPGTENFEPLPVVVPIATSEGAHRAPDVASDGAGYLVVWDDMAPGKATADIHGALISASGMRLGDGSDLPVTTAPGSQARPRIAFANEDVGTYLVAWDEIIWPEGQESPHFEVHGVRLGADGQRKDPSDLVLAAGSDEHSGPAIAYGGGSFLVGWKAKNQAAFSAVGTRIATTGEVFGGKIELASVLSPVGDLGIVYDGTDHLVVWSSPGESWRVLGRPVTANGEAKEAFVIAHDSVTPLLEPVAAVAGSSVLVAWTDKGSVAFGNDVFAARVAGGALLSATPIPVSVTRGLLEDVVVASDGAQYLVAWTEAQGASYGLYGRRVDATGKILDAVGIPIAKDVLLYGPEPPVVVGGPAGFLVVWLERAEPIDGPASAVVRGTLLGHAGEPQRAGVTIAMELRERRSLGAVADPFLGYGVVWEEKREAGWDVYAAYVSASFLDPPIAVASATADETDPVMAVTATEALVVYKVPVEGRETLLSARIGNRGILTPGERFIPAGTLGATALASLDTSYLLAFVDLDAAEGIAGAVVQGGIFAPAMPFSAVRAGTRADVAVVALGGRWLVLWQDEALPESETFEVWGLWIEADGTVGSDVGSLGVHNSPGLALAAGQDAALWVTHSTGAERGERVDHVVGRLVRPSSTMAPDAAPPVDAMADALVDATSPALSPRRANFYDCQCGVGATRDARTVGGMLVLGCFLLAAARLRRA